MANRKLGMQRSPALAKSAREFLVGGGIPRPRSDLEADGPLGYRREGVPEARLDVDAERFASGPQGIRRRHAALIVELKECD